MLPYKRSSLSFQVGFLSLFSIFHSCKSRQFNSNPNQIAIQNAIDFTRSSFSDPSSLIQSLDLSFSKDASPLRSLNYCFRKGLLKYSTSKETNFNAISFMPIVDYLESKAFETLKTQKIQLKVSNGLEKGGPYPCNDRFKDAFEFESVTNSNPSDEDLSEFASLLLARLSWIKSNRFLPYRAFLTLTQDWSVLIARSVGNKKFDFRNLEIPGIYLDEMLSKQSFPYLFPTPAELDLWPFLQLRNIPLIPIGLSTQNHYVDGIDMDPFNFHYHDFQHAVRGELDSLQHMSIKNENSDLRFQFVQKEVLEIKKLNALLNSSPVKFGIARGDLELVLFTFVHEEGQCMQNAALDFELIQTKLKMCNLKTLAQSIASLHGVTKDVATGAKMPWTPDGIQKAVELLATSAFLAIKANTH
jgi:hypothetical protein